MGRSSSKPLQKPNSPLQEMQFKELQRERIRLQQEKLKKQIIRLQKKQAKKQRKTKRKHSSLRLSITSQDNAETSFNHDDAARRCDINRQLENKTQKQLNEDLCEFILNQMVLTMQFFKNYERELFTIAEEILNSEKQFNHNLEEHSILITNPLDMAVAKWICFKPLHGADKHNAQLLQTQTMYVVFENIDIARPNDANYDSISPLCKVDIELDCRESTPCKEDYLQMLNNINWKGYVRLKLRENVNQSKIATATNSEDLYSEGSSGYGTTSPYIAKTAFTSLGNATEDDYDYVYIARLNTQYPLKDLKMSNVGEINKIDAKVLPESCISSLDNFVRPLQEAEFSDDEEEESENDSDGSDDMERTKKYAYRDYDTLQAIKLYKIELEKRCKLLAQNYLNSREFMKYFGELVRKKLAENLNITETELNDATYRGTSIHTSKYELIPAIYAAQNVTDWPRCAFEFRLRERPISTNPRTGQHIQWPTRAMIKRIETFGFHVIPVGYAPKKKRNPFREIEWRIVFPKAERYLEQHLTTAQVKVYMISKTLIKNFVEPVEKNKALMFALDHLRTHLFWECEKDYTAWPEEFLGEVLFRFINSFKQRVKAKHLSDFFIRERNLFESIPEYSLNSLCTILADITANPLMHLMVAFRNLEFKFDFFPKFNFKKLYENLTENDIVKLKMLAKNARCLKDLEQDAEVQTCLMPDEDARGLVGLKEHHVRTNGKLRRKTHLLRHNIEMKKQEMQTKRRSVESIDVEFVFKRNINFSNSIEINQGVENLRRTNILEIAIDHLMEMTAKAIQFETVVVAKTYLTQARKLCKCYHNYGCDMGAKEYLSSIHDLDEELQIIYDKEDFSMVPPSLPGRISMEPVLPEIPHSFPNSCLNLYEEMISPQEMSLTPTDMRKDFKISSIRNISMQKAGEAKETTGTEPLPELRKSIRFHPIVYEVKTDDISPLATQGEIDIQSCLKSSNKIMTPKASEIKKSIKFQSDTNAVQKSECYSPDDSKVQENKYSECEYEGTNKAELQKIPQHSDSSASHAEKKSVKSVIPPYLSNKLKSSKDFITSSTQGSAELFQDLKQNTNHILNHITAEEKRAQIREMLKRKTVQLKGVFNQSSDT